MNLPPPSHSFLSLSSSTPAFGFSSSPTSISSSSILSLAGSVGSSSGIDLLGGINVKEESTDTQPRSIPSSSSLTYTSPTTPLITTDNSGGLSTITTSDPTTTINTTAITTNTATTTTNTTNAFSSNTISSIKEERHHRLSRSASAVSFSSSFLSCPSSSSPCSSSPPCSSSLSSFSSSCDDLLLVDSLTADLETRWALDRDSLEGLVQRLKLHPNDMTVRLEVFRTLRRNLPASMKSGKQQQQQGEQGNSTMEGNNSVIGTVVKDDPNNTNTGNTNNSCCDRINGIHAAAAAAAAVGSGLPISSVEHRSSNNIFTNHFHTTSVNSKGTNTNNSMINTTDANSSDTLQHSSSTASSSSSSSSPSINVTVSDILNHDLLPLILSSLHSDTYPNLQCEALFMIHRLTYGSPVELRRMLEQDLLESLISLLDWAEVGLRNDKAPCVPESRHALMATLRNLFVSSREVRNVLLGSRAYVERILGLASLTYDLVAAKMVHAMIVPANLIGHVPCFYPDGFRTAESAHFLSRCIEHGPSDPHILVTACTGLMYICDKLSDVQCLLDTHNCLCNLILLLLYPVDNIAFEALSILAKIAYAGTTAQIDFLIRAGAVRQLVRLLRGYALRDPSGILRHLYAPRLLALHRARRAPAQQCALPFSDDQNNVRRRSSTGFLVEEGRMTATHEGQEDDEEGIHFEIFHDSGFDVELYIYKNVGVATRARACNCLGNIGCETYSQVKILIENEVFPILIHIFKSDSDYNTRIEAAYAVCAAVSRASPAQVLYIISCTRDDNNCMHLIADMLELVSQSDPNNIGSLKLCKAVLRGLDNILNCGITEAQKEGLWENPYKIMFTKCLGEHKLRDMVFYPDYNIVTRTQQILAKFFTA